LFLLTTFVINDTKIVATHNPKTIIVGLNTFQKNVFNPIYFSNVLTKSPHFPHDFLKHQSNIANGENTINIHKYTTLINATIHNTPISIAKIIVVHHCIIVVNIVDFIPSGLESLILTTDKVFKIEYHIKYNGQATLSGFGIILSK
jgi:hypothetical protein